MFVLKLYGKLRVFKVCQGNKPITCMLLWQSIIIKNKGYILNWFELMKRKNLNITHILKNVSSSTSYLNINDQVLPLLAGSNETFYKW